MEALGYHGAGQTAWEDRPNPTIPSDTDVTVRVDAVTVCGTDLHILKGDVPAVTDGRILGDEAVGTAVAVGAAVKTLEVGDRVLVSCSGRDGEPALPDRDRDRKLDRDVHHRGRGEGPSGDLFETFGRSQPWGPERRMTTQAADATRRSH